MLYLERLKKIGERLVEIEQQLISISGVAEASQLQKLMKEAAQLRPIVRLFEIYQKLEKEEQDLQTGLKEKALDAEMQKLYHEELAALIVKKEKTKTELEDLLLEESDDNAKRDVIIEVRAGTGGDEAALFVADLYRMYSKYATEKGLKTELMSSNPTGKGGFKELIFGINGTNAYSLFKFESGIHRVQRVPATESSGRIHTSAVTVAVLPEADETELEIEPKDLKIDVFRASGAGGQHVNKTESAVRITHFPTGTVVSCQDERSQHKNKAKALRVLRARVFEMRRLAQHNAMAKERKQQVGSGDRSGKIRTYNFLDRRVTDHRIGLTLHALDDILNGHLDEVVKALAQHERTQRLIQAA